MDKCWVRGVGRAVERVIACTAASAQLVLTARRCEMLVLCCVFCVVLCVYGKLWCVVLCCVYTVCEVLCCVYGMRGVP